MTADEAPAERLHPLAVLSGLGQAIRNMVGGLAAGGFVAFQGRVGLGLLILGGMMLSTLGGLLFHWLRFSYRVGEDAVRIDSGILSRNHRTLPFDRIADVSIAQGPLQRLFGVARVTLETGSSTVGSEEGVLAAVGLHRAEALRDHVRKRRSGIAGDDAAVAQAAETEAPPLFAMDLRRVLTCGLFNFSLALFAGLFGASQTLGDLIKVDPFEREFWQPILARNDLGDWLLDHRLGLAIGGLAVLIVAGMLTGLVRTLLREWGYRLDRTANGFRRRRGLLTRTDVSLPLRRIQAGVIATGPVRDRFGWRALSVQSLASDTTGGRGPGGDHVLAPLARDPELVGIADELRWHLPSASTEWKRVSRAHVWSYLAVLATMLAGMATLATAIALVAGDGSPQDVVTSLARDGARLRANAAIVAGLFASFLLVMTALRWLDWKRTAFALEDRRLLIRTGWWRRRTFLLPLANVQSVNLVETSLSRLFGTAHLIIATAGGSLWGARIPSLSREEASQVRFDLLSHRP